MSVNERRRPVASVLSTAVGAGVQRGAQGLLIFALIGVASRAYDELTVGIAGIAVTAALVTAALADFGTTPMSLREFAAVLPSKAEFYQLLRVKLAVACAATCLLLVGTFAVAPRPIALAIASAAGSIPVSAVVSTATSLLIVAGSGVQLVVASIAGLFGGAAVLFVCVRCGAPGWMLLLAFVSARLVEASVQIACVKFSGAQRSAISYDLRAVVRCWPLAAQAALQVVYQRTALIITAATLGTLAAGQIAQGQTLYSLLALAPSVLSTVLVPTLVNARSRGKLLSTVHKTRWSLVLLVIPLAAVLFLLASTILDVAYGASDANTVAFLRWSAPALGIAGYNSVTAYLFVVSGREHLLAALSIVTTLGALTILILATHLWGVAGAGFALLGAEIWTLLVFQSAAYRRAFTEVTPSST